MGSLTTQCKQKSPEKPKPVNETDIVIPEGFSLQVVAEDLGNLRHMTLSKNGDIYVNRSKLNDEKGIILLKDTDNDGKIDAEQQFGNLPGTGILIKNGYLYTSSNSGVYRYKLNENEEIIDIENPENIVDGLADKGRDNAKSFVMDDNVFSNLKYSVSKVAQHPYTGVTIEICTLFIIFFLIPFH